MISRSVERRADGLFGSLQEPQPILSSEGQMRLAREVKDARSLLSVADWPLVGFLRLFGLVTVHLWMCSRIQMPEDQEIKCI